jgi:hypothetical protein
MNEPGTVNDGKGNSPRTRSASVYTSTSGHAMHVRSVYAREREWEREDRLQIARNGIAPDDVHEDQRTRFRPTTGDVNAHA